MTVALSAVADLASHKKHQAIDFIGVNDGARTHENRNHNSSIKFIHKQNQRLAPLSHFKESLNEPEVVGKTVSIQHTFGHTNLLLSKKILSWLAPEKAPRYRTSRVFLWLYILAEQ